MIPPGSVVVKPPDQREDEWGHKLFLVVAHQGEAERGRSAWAGIGWTQDDAGAGLFVEHHGHARDHVETQISQSLSAMCSYRARRFVSVDSAVIGIECRGDPVCALVAAVYCAEGWPTDALDGRSP